MRRRRTVTPPMLRPAVPTPIHIVMTQMPRLARPDQLATTSTPNRPRQHHRQPPPTQLLVQPPITHRMPQPSRQSRQPRQQPLPSTKPGREKVAAGSGWGRGLKIWLNHAVCEVFFGGDSWVFLVSCDADECCEGEDADFGDDEPCLGVGHSSSSSGSGSGVGVGSSGVSVSVSSWRCLWVVFMLASGW